MHIQGIRLEIRGRMIISAPALTLSVAARYSLLTYPLLPVLGAFGWLHFMRSAGCSRLKAHADLLLDMALP